MSLTPQDRVGYSPKEFAALWGKSQTWGYRQIYAGKVNTITEYGRIMIPAVEVDRILKTAGVYDGMKSKTPKTKVEIQRLQPKIAATWGDYLAKRAAGGAESGGGKNILAALTASRAKRSKGGNRRSALSRFNDIEGDSPR